MKNVDEEVFISAAWESSSLLVASCTSLVGFRDREDDDSRDGRFMMTLVVI
jgi:hypothetical protein